MLETLVSKVSRQLENDTASSTEDLESICFCIATIHEAVPEDEDEFLQILFQGNLFSVFSGATTPDTVQLRRTILHLIGEQSVTSRVHNLKADRHCKTNIVLSHRRVCSMV